MISFLRTASILDTLGCFKLSDRFTKVAIDLGDLDPRKVYRNPQTLSDFVLNESINKNKDPLEVLGDEDFTVDPYKDPMEQLLERSQGPRRHFAVYPQIILFPENGIWKFFFLDPLSLKSLSKGSDKDGKLLTDQLSVPGLLELYGEEEEAEEISHEVVFTTNLTLEDNSTTEAKQKIRDKFQDASVDVMFNGVDDREFFDEEKYIVL